MSQIFKWKSCVLWSLISIFLISSLFSCSTTSNNSSQSPSKDQKEEINEYNTTLLIPTFIHNESEYDFFATYWATVIDRSTNNEIDPIEILPQNGYTLVNSIPPGAYAITEFNAIGKNGETGFVSIRMKDQFMPFDIVDNAIVTTDFSYGLKVEQINYEDELTALFKIVPLENKDAYKIQCLEKYFTEHPDSSYSQDEIMIGLSLIEDADPALDDSYVRKFWNRTDQTVYTKSTSSITITGFGTSYEK